MLSRVITSQKQFLKQYSSSTTGIWQPRFISGQTENEQPNKYLPYLNDATDAFKKQTDAYFYPEDDPATPYFLHSFFFRTLPHEQLQSKLGQQLLGVDGKFNLTPLLGKMNLHQVDALVRTLRQNPSNVSDIQSQEGALALAKFAYFNDFEDLKMEVLKKHKANFLNHAMYWWEMEEWEISTMTPQELNDIVRQIATQPGLNEVNIPMLRLHYRISHLEKKISNIADVVDQKVAQIGSEENPVLSSTIPEKQIKQILEKYLGQFMADANLKFQLQKSAQQTLGDAFVGTPSKQNHQLTQQQVQDMLDRKHTAVEQKLLSIQNMVQNMDWAAKTNKDTLFRKVEQINQKMQFLENFVKTLDGPLPKQNNKSPADEMSSQIIDHVQKLQWQYASNGYMVYIMSIVCYTACMWLLLFMLQCTISIDEELAELKEKLEGNPNFGKEKQIKQKRTVLDRLGNLVGGIFGAFRSLDESECLEKPQENL